jgi:S-(hydroxymethyl)glutathione dehydrogenase/alcohol dehydrogenase
MQQSSRLRRQWAATHVVDGFDGGSGRGLQGIRPEDVVSMLLLNPPVVLRRFARRRRRCGPGGQVIWLGKVDVQQDISFRWGSLMQEKRIRRVSYGNARPRRDFPMLAQAYLDGTLTLDSLISRRISLDEINAGFDALKRGETIRRRRDIRLN